MPVSPDSRGPLAYSQLVRFNQVSFWLQTRPPKIDPDDSDILYIVKDGDTCVTLSNRFYRNPNMDWVIKRRNNIFFDDNEMITGDEIFIPTESSLRARGLNGSTGR